MRTIGFSTGALAAGDFRRGLELLRGQVDAIELSALRLEELEPLVDSLDELDLGAFRLISFHAPSHFPPDAEEWVLQMLQRVAGRGWPIIVHPDSFFDIFQWRGLGRLLTIENMDLRKSTGRFAAELASIFEDLPEARLCLDLGHSRQTDPTMTEAFRILRGFGDRLVELHLSEVDAAGQHAPLSVASISAYQEIARHLSDGVPVILESPVAFDGIQAEVQKALEALLELPARSFDDWGPRIAAVR